MRLKLLEPELHLKNWGREEWFFNSQNPNLCFKILKIKKGHEFSLHAHDSKQEIFFCRDSKIKLTYIDTSDASKHEIILNTGDSIFIPRLVPHRITALEDSEIIELSTFHSELDSLRFEPGDSQKNK